MALLFIKKKKERLLGDRNSSNNALQIIKRKKYYPFHNFKKAFQFEPSSFFLLHLLLPKKWRQWRVKSEITENFLKKKNIEVVM